MKICSKCKKEKELNNFTLSKRGYYHSWCKECRAKIEKIRRDIKFEEIALKGKIKYEKNKEIIKQRRKDNRESTKEN